jgi:fatty-acyl-CoA synthase/long-chain acyl-CoA synthetase
MIQPFELLETAAARYPSQIGMVSESRVYTFQEMHGIAQGFAAKFHSQGLRPRQVASTFLPPDLDWLSTLAIFHEAAVPVSLWGAGSVSNLNVSWFVGTSLHPNVPKQQTIILDSNDLKPVASTHPRTLYARPDKPMRYVLTSGTTGSPKAVTFTGGNIQARLDNLGTYWADERPELNFMGLSTTGGFFTALAALQNGYQFMAELAVNPSAIERAKEHQIKVLAGSPSQIGHALKLMNEHDLQIPSLEEVRVAGSSPSEKLISAIHNDLGVPVKSVYGSTEGGGVAFTMLSPGDDTSDLGEIVDGVELEVEASDGPSGRIRYRGPGVSPGYMESTGDDSSFENGWFYPGDLGHVSETGHLILEGRSDELMNFGGTKLNPEKIEQLAKDFAGVADAGVCLVERVPGIEEVAIAVVGESALDLRALDQILRAKLPIGHPTVFTRAHQIPRNRMGKIVREELKNQILRDLRLS